MADVKSSSAETLAGLDVLIVPSPALCENPIAFLDVEESTGLYAGGQVRLSAAAEFSIRYEPRLIIVVGGMDGKNRFRMTAEMSQFVLQRNSRAHVTRINSLPCTRHNIVAIFNQLGTQLEGQRIGILTNEYHLLRFLALWLKLSELYGLKLAPPVAISAESICSAGHQSTYAAAYEKRVRAEADGIAHWQAGKYIDRCLEQLATFGEELGLHPGWYLAPDERNDPRAVALWRAKTD